ncbi:DUF423 domain-containing protein [Ningiella sp. W23]|uniref:DUF423 domain-containing protein n=1 Tax=Ningiella sp. W23 TaxID=3023715 RepID=UPI003756A0EF
MTLEKHSISAGNVIKASYSEAQLRYSKLSLCSGVVFALLGVAIGAFAAHGLKSSMSTYEMNLIETAARYQMYHAFAMILVGLLGLMLSTGVNANDLGITKALKCSCVTFALGIVCFSASLYIFAISGVKWLVFITPIGGLLFILGWLAFLFMIIKGVHVLSSQTKATKYENDSR